MAELFCQIKRSVAEQFRQIKRSVAEHYSNINFNLARALEDKGSFIRHTHQIRCVALVIVVCTIQLGCAQTRSSGIQGAKGAMLPLFHRILQVKQCQIKATKMSCISKWDRISPKNPMVMMSSGHILYFSFPTPSTNKQ